MNRKKIIGMIVMTMALTALMAVTAFASGGGSEFTVDVTGIITTAMGSMATQISTVIGIIAPVVVGIAAGIIALKKGISVFKSLAGH